MSWFDTLPAFALVFSVLFLPGGLIALALGARGVPLIAAAPALGVGAIGASGIAGGVLGVPWSIPLLAAGTVAIAAGAWLFARFIGPRPPRQPGAWQWRGLLGMAAGAAFAAVVIGQQLKFGIDRPDHFSQRYDNVFHLNAVRYILETDNASMLTLGRMISPSKALAIYPSAWHSITALVADGTGLAIPVASNVVNIAVAAVVWPLSCIFLSYILFGARLFPLALTGVASASFPAFPTALFEFGPLFPNTLSYAVLPVAAGFLAVLFGLGRPTGMSTGGLIAALAVSCAALGTAQPNGLVALMALFAPVGLAAWARWWTRTRGESRTRRFLLVQCGVLLGAAALFVVFWKVLLLGYDSREPFTTGGAALGEALTGSASSTHTTWVLAAAILIGVATLFRQRESWWILGWFAVLATLYIVVASVPRGPLRMALTGAWYQDAPRLAALLPMISVVLAVAGAAWLAARLTDAVNARAGVPGGLKRAAPLVIGAALLALVIPGAFSQAMEDSAEDVRRAYSFDPKYADILTLDERALIGKLPSLVPEGSVIGVNPWNGGALAYSYTGLEVSQYHMTKPDESLASVAQSADSADAGSETCSAARELDIEYVLDFGDNYLLDFDQAFAYPAFDNAEDSRYSLVEKVGEARLYQLTNCFEEAAP